MRSRWSLIHSDTCQRDHEEPVVPHPQRLRVRGIMRSRWSLIHSDYVSIQETVLASPRLMAQTSIQLFELNQRTISQWFTRRQKRWERSVLEQGVAIVPAPAVADRPLLPAKELSVVLVGQGRPFQYHLPEEQPGPSTRSLPPPAPPQAPPQGPQPPSAPPPLPPNQAVLPTLAATSSAQLPPPPPVVPRTTAYRRRKAAEAAAAGVVAPPRKQHKIYMCSKCGQPKRLDTGHTRIGGVSYCATVGGKSVEEWRKDFKKE
ncbi:formin-like protein 14 [Fundulus heteroclitus]|uniref:formin-like protein 14 n=1 Tax=Fundulus heteroclitus TaxID=8078 RepID=UPI00165CA03A|nr:formin-like protein 14 [Fundulus heteroclitus]